MSDYQAIAPTSNPYANLPKVNLKNIKNNINVDLRELRDSYDSTTSRAIAKVRDANVDRLSQLYKFDENAY